jgi:hypothetical protein
MFINFSNHSSENWREEQWNYTIEKYGEIIDVPFPEVGVDATEREINLLAEDCVNAIMETIGNSDGIVMCQGEFTLTYAVVSRLLARNIVAVAAMTERKAKEIYNGNKVVKISEFVFKGYRRYGS